MDLIDNDNELKRLKNENNKLRWILFIEIILIDLILFLLLF
jgi:hypothetical protein